MSFGYLLGQILRGHPTFTFYIYHSTFCSFFKLFIQSHFIPLKNLPKRLPQPSEERINDKF